MTLAGLYNTDDYTVYLLSLTSLYLLILYFDFSRFIINVPEEERQNLIRICFQIELAHWFYIDFYCDEHNLKPYGINQFAQHMFRVIIYIVYYIIFI